MILALKTISSNKQYKSKVGKNRSICNSAPRLWPLVIMADEDIEQVEMIMNSENVETL